MTKIQSTLSYLGKPYELTTIDGEEVIYRKLSNGYEFEVSGIHGSSKTCTIYVWSPARTVVGIYSSIQFPESLKDVLGHLAFKYQNLTSEIQVEREE